MDDVALNKELIGAPGGRLKLNTPVLVVELDALDRNIARMASLERPHDLAPPAKIKKSVDVGAQQVAARGCCQFNGNLSP